MFPLKSIAFTVNVYNVPFVRPVITAFSVPGATKMLSFSITEIAREDVDFRYVTSIPKRSLSVGSFHVRRAAASLFTTAKFFTSLGAVSSAIIVFSLIETVATLTGLFSIPSLIAIAFTVASFVNSMALLYFVLFSVGNVPSVV